MRISDWSSDVCSSDLNLRVQLRTLSGAIVVPLSAVRNGSQGDFVYLINADHTVSVRTVTRGQQSGSQVQVMTGLKLGERVVTEGRSEEHTSELQSLMRISYAVFCLKKKKK